MTTFIKAKLKKTDNQTNIDKYNKAENYIILYHIKINLPKNHHSKKYVKMFNSACLKWTFCYAFYILPNDEFGIDRIILGD